MQPMSETRKLDYLKLIEKRYCRPRTAEVSEQPRYFLTFPYAYMNGKLHLGHLFSFSKAEFMSRYKVLRGYNVLFPFAFHCTGMPISASAQRLESELKEEGGAAEESVSSQRYILKQMGFADVRPFVDPLHWVRTFSVAAETSLRAFNSNIDWRRSFITTDQNPYYDSFVRWQFEILWKKGLLFFGKRYSIFCPEDGQPCLDHDRLRGEGVGPAPVDLLKIEAVLRSGAEAHSLVKCVSADSRPVHLCVRLKSPGVPVSLSIPAAASIVVLAVEDNILMVEEHVHRNLQHQVRGAEVMGLLKGESLGSLCFRFQGACVSAHIRDSGQLAMKLETHDNNAVSLLENEVAALSRMAENKTDFSLNMTSSVIRYFEPEDTVVSRSGFGCVVALLDQWFIDYGNREWKAATQRALERMECSKDTRDVLRDGIEWINKWAFSRTFGLGTRIPWDEKYLIDSLSDSTIYTSLYTFKHLLYRDIFGKDEIFPRRHLSGDVWNYIFRNCVNVDIDLDEGALEAALGTKNMDILRECRRSLEYFYPVDLRVSGKDLLKNHLLFYMFNHVAIFRPEYLPRRIETNGFMLLNSSKMSKSTGNFLSIDDVVAKYGESATKMCLASCGDSNEDANFLESAANAYVLKLYTFIEQARAAAKSTTPRRGTFEENFLLECIGNNVREAERAYEKMLFRDVVKYGYHEMLNEYETFLGLGGDASSDVVRELFRTMVVVLYPVIPSVSGLLNEECFHTDLVWPAVPSSENRHINAVQYLKRLMRLVIRRCRKRCAKLVRIGVSEKYEKWKEECIRCGPNMEQLRSIFREYNVPEKHGMAFAMDYHSRSENYVCNFDEFGVLCRFRAYLESGIGTKVVVEKDERGDPLNPNITFEF